MMNTTAAQYKDKSGLVTAFGVGAALLVGAVLTNVNLAFGISDRVAFFALLVIGLTMCSMGKLGRGAIDGWFNPLHLIGYVVGGLGLLLAGAVLFNLPIPQIPTERTAIEVLAGLMLVKLLVAQFYPRRA